MFVDQSATKDKARYAQMSRCVSSDLKYSSMLCVLPH